MTTAKYVAEKKSEKRSASASELVTLLLPLWGAISITLYWCLILTPLFFVPLLHMAWIVYDRNTPHAAHGTTKKWLRQLCIWKTGAQYFPIQLVKTVELDPNVNYVCGYHPHGMYSFGAFGCFSTESVNFSQLFPGLTPRVASHNKMFLTPILRELFLALGHCATSKESLSSVLSQKDKGVFLVIAVGGVREIITARPYSMKLKLKDRKGFVRVAVKNGAHLIPILNFGENEVYPPLLPLAAAQLFDTILYPIIYAWGYLKLIYPKVPKKMPVTIVVGKPIEVVRDENASEEVIDKYHQQYIQSLQQLFEEYKTKVGDEYKTMELTLY